MALTPVDLPQEICTSIIDFLWSDERPSAAVPWCDGTCNTVDVRDDILNLEDLAAFIINTPQPNNIFRLRNVNNKLSATFADWFYKRHMFEFRPMATIAPTNTDHGSAWKAQEIKRFHRFLYDMGPANRARLRKLSLTMPADHVLLLFAPPECTKMLHLPVDSFPLLQEMRSMFSEMTLNILEIHFTADLCSLPTVHEDRLDSGLHIRPDYRWAAKAVIETMSSAGYKGVGKGQSSAALRFFYYFHDNQEFHIQHKVLDPECQQPCLRSCSWAALQSTTAGYHRHDSLEFASEALFAAGNGSGATMRFPIVLEPAIPRQGNASADVKEEQDDEGWNLEDFPAINLSAP
ncbi:hypothetical protein H2203_003626 [Taxawa tesnikishii (nom. ined.)]|nr:hypothetical protein H2203_003626 [Dothideales sp. JES 119]